jgi:hypothetical protein
VGLPAGCVLQFNKAGAFPSPEELFH